MNILEAAKMATKKGDKISSKKGMYEIDFEHFPTAPMNISRFVDLDDWEFTPAEPKILTAEEIVSVARKKRDLRDVMSDGALIEMANDSIKNGQLKEQIRTKKLIEAARSVFKFNWDTSSPQLSDLRCALNKYDENKQ